LLVACAAAVVRLRTTAARILALDTLTVVLVALVVVYSIGQRSSYYMDAALILALLAFVSTLVAARYHGEKKVL
jgi:multicomponent Na+:H+ antiporter subunit F